MMPREVDTRPENDHSRWRASASSPSCDGLEPSREQEQLAVPLLRKLGRRTSRLRLSLSSPLLLRYVLARR